MSSSDVIQASLLSMGFTEEQIATALANPNIVTVDAAISFIMDGPSEDDAAAAAEAVVGGFLHNQPHKLTLVVRRDLGMSTGKVAAQSVHAALGVVRRASEEVVEAWEALGETTVVLGCQDLAELEGLEAAAEATGLPTHRVSDAGRTEVEPGAVTVLAIGPAPIADIDTVTGQLSLL